MEYNQLLMLITVIYTLATLFTAVAVTIKKKYNFLICNIVTYALYIAFLITQYMLNFRIRIFIIALVILTLIGNSLVGQYLDLYMKSRTYDRYLHILGCFSFALFFYYLIANVTSAAAGPDVYVALYVASLGITAGCLLEILEYCIDSKSRKGMKNQHGLRDTDTDMIANVIGASIAGVVSVFL